MRTCGDDSSATPGMHRVYALVCYTRHVIHSVTINNYRHNDYHRVMQIYPNACTKNTFDVIPRVPRSIPLVLFAVAFRDENFFSEITPFNFCHLQSVCTFLTPLCRLSITDRASSDFPAVRPYLWLGRVCF